MKVWALISNVDDIVEQYGFAAFEKKTMEEWYEVFLMDYADIEIADGEGLSIYYRGEKMELPEAFWPMLTNTDSYCLEHMLMEAGCRSIIDLDEAAVVRSKAATYQRLSANGIRIPKTIVFFNHPDKERIMKELSFPFIVKPDNGYGGSGVSLIYDEEEFDSFLSELQFGVVYMAQEYIASSKGKDLRMIYCMGEYFYSIVRQSNNNDEFRSNVHLGGEILDYQPDEETKALCRNIAGLFHLPVVGIDLLFGEDGFVVTEINSSPGLSAENNEKVAKMVMDKFLSEKGGGANG